MNEQELQELARFINMAFPCDDDSVENMNTSNAKGIPFIDLEKKEWNITIDLIEHTVVDYPMGLPAIRVWSKVCDQGKYRLLDKDMRLVSEIRRGYVPNGVIPPKDGCGDYIDFTINPDGTIDNWYNHYDFTDFTNKGRPYYGTYKGIPLNL